MSRLDYPEDVKSYLLCWPGDDDGGGDDDDTRT